MFANLRIDIEKHSDINMNIGSLMQGVLMENISPKYAQMLHMPGIQPYSQYIAYGENDTVHWNIMTCTREARENISDVLMEKLGETIHLSHKNIDLRIKNMSLETLTEEELMSRTYFGECSSYINITFITPTAFKSVGQYQFYPTVNHVFQSLINKYDACSDGAAIYSPQLMEDINERVRVTSYNLRSTSYHLEGIKIPAFRGSITFRVKGSQMFKNMLHMLAQFGEYSGVGIKTAIGMGAIKVRKNI